MYPKIIHKPKQKTMRNRLIRDEQEIRKIFYLPKDILHSLLASKDQLGHSLVFPVQIQNHHHQSQLHLRQVFQECHVSSWSWYWISLKHQLLNSKDNREKLSYRCHFSVVNAIRRGRIDFGSSSNLLYSNLLRAWKKLVFINRNTRQLVLLVFVPFETGRCKSRTPIGSNYPPKPASSSLACVAGWTRI